MDSNNGHMAKRFRNDSGSAVRAGGRVSRQFNVPRVVKDVKILLAAHATTNAPEQGQRRIWAPAQAGLASARLRLVQLL